ncbi:ATP-binding protein [Metabacillus arenae]|uniref:histidine kinase n=1 Tax=Metabacillus arenae TaxID=2771434 RepID=A0A926S1V4_9BACI|nr:ATP-binding protein [Metabacillus arenae]MBD1381349.1 ATP-binding protein [Metabacillus arenae]
MLESIQSLCLHVVFILFSTLLYQVFFQENHEARKKIGSKFFILTLIILLFTMIQPVSYSDQYKYDFKAIAIILAFLYGGKQVGFAVFTFLLLFGYFTDHRMLVLAGNYTIFCVLLIPISNLFHTYRRRGKMIVISLFFLTIPITRTIYLFLMDDYTQMLFELTSSFIIWATLAAVVFLIENMGEQLEMRQELQKTEKLNVISQLAASVAHEIRNPMTSVRGFMQLLQREPLTREQKRYIDVSIDELDRAQEIINQYLALAKPQTNENEIINFTELIHKTIDIMHSYSVLNNIQITHQIEDSLKIKGSRIEIQQVLINLIKNAIEAIQSEGVIRIMAKMNDNQTITVQVEDNGIGMSIKQINRLGSPYYSTKEKGTGLGLTVCFQIIKQMGGKIKIASEPGKGTCFTITFIT